MLDRIEILVEEPSIAEVLRGILPSILPNGWNLDANCFIRCHNGKQDLQRSIPHKLRSASGKNIRTGFIILQDQDSDDCVRLKHKLTDMCDKAITSWKVSYKVRIVCHELESWYLGDMDAIEHVFSQFHAKKYKNRKIFRNPDQCINPKRELKKLVEDYPQIATAREIAKHMSVDKNTSRSFNCFINCLLQMTI